MPEQNKSGFAKLNDLSKDEVKNAIASYSVLPRGYSIGVIVTGKQIGRAHV